MKASVMTFHPAGTLVALVGNPNSGKTALFNLLTGSHQKVANYAGVTVERKEGRLQLNEQLFFRVLDLPGVYSLYPRAADERVTCEVLAGKAQGEKKPDLIICVLDATNLRRNLRLVLSVKRMGIPCVVALNMMDVAEKRGIKIDTAALSAALDLPVVATIANQSGGDGALKTWLTHYDKKSMPLASPNLTHEDTQQQDQIKVQAILAALKLDRITPPIASDNIDKVILHPIAGPLILMSVLFFIFQSVFAWAELPMSWIEACFALIAEHVTAWLPDNWLRSLLVDGIIAGAGGVVVFLPQILILFFFILILEESGYLPRAAYLLDRIMGSVGLSGRSFIPLLSSFACAIPGIMAARSISNERDRIVTILIAPLMTCSARLPVYTLLIAAFIPDQSLFFGVNLQGLVMFVLYMAGIFGAMTVALLLKVFTKTGQMPRPLMMELPTYHWPTLRNVAIGLWQRASIFMQRVGGIILVMTIIIWFLASYPSVPEGFTGNPITQSFAGQLGQYLAVLLEPIGFNWQISIALVPGMAAREVVVSALGSVYALSATAGDTEKLLMPLLAASWSLPTALSLLAWFVFAPQCLSTLAITKRETGGWRIPLIMMTYLFALAYLAAFVTFRVATYYLG
jgi:ferrous iron transport protein B